MQAQPIDFHPPTEEAPAVLLPVATGLFSERAERFASLAEGHSLGDWLVFLGRLSRTQQAALAALPELPLPDAAALEQARQYGMPPLDTATRPAAWHDVLRQLARDLAGLVPAAARPTLERLAEADDARLEQLADRLLGGEPQAADAAELPFVGAALQVAYTHLAGRLPAGQVQRLDPPTVCPCCGSLPVASIVRLGATINNLRYLHCALCNTEWNVSRATCTSCQTDKEVAQQQIEGTAGAVRAETCDHCKSYLKIVYQEKDPRVDPVADDLATLALDLLVDEAGYGRSGPNLLLAGAHSE
jgi:FdhE protein